MERVAAIVLAGGQGKRMGILCRHRPKPGLPFAGTHRVIDFALSNCLHSEICTIAPAIDFQRSYMSGYLRKWHAATGKKDLRMDILEAKSHYLGTADAVYQNKDYLTASGADNLLVLAADHVYKMDYRPMLSFHQQMKADATIGVISMPREQARRFGSVCVDANNRVLDFAEKAETPGTGLVSMGIYVFNAKSILERLSEDAKTDSLHDFGYSILPGMVREDRVFAYRFDGYWRDVGTPEAYHRANVEIARGQTAFSLDGNWPIVTARDPRPEPGLSPQARAHRSILSPGCTIMGYVENSVVGPGAYVEEHAVVRNSVLMDNVFIGERSVVQSCIVDEGVSVGPCCEIGAKDRFVLASNPIAILSAGAGFRSRRSLGESVENVREGIDDPLMSSPVADRLP